MNIKRNNSISFGIKVNKNLSSTLKKELKRDYADSLPLNATKHKYTILNKELEEKFQQISGWGEDSYELFETIDKLRERRTIGLRKGSRPNSSYLFKPLGKNLLKCFLTLKKSKVFEGILKLEENTAIINKN